MIWAVAALLLSTADARDDIEEVCVLADRPTRDRYSPDVRDDSVVFSVPEGYRRARRALARGRWPVGDFSASDFVNHFPYSAKPPKGVDSLALTLEVAPHPFDDTKHIARVIVTGPGRSARQRDPTHLTFLVDVSDSMTTVFTRKYPVLEAEEVHYGQGRQLFAKSDRLSLAKGALGLVVDDLDVRGTVAIATFGAGSEVVLEPTSLHKRKVIRDAIASIQAPDEPKRDRGVKNAYKLALAAFDACDDNRLIAVGDGGATLGGDPRAAFAKLSERAAGGVAVSVLGVGLRNIRSADMERIAWVGYGNAYYADSLYDAVLALRRELLGSSPILRDVEFDVSFDLDKVASSRRIGDSASWIPSQVIPGWQFTALYEIEITDASADVMTASWAAGSPVPGDWTRYGDAVVHARQIHHNFDDASPDFRFAVAAALFASALQEGDDSRLEALFLTIQKADRPHAVDSELLALIALARRVRNTRR
jgi:Ca-activated chloride channel family protein